MTKALVLIVLASLVSLVASGLVLRQVQVVTRHGGRSPFTQIPNNAAAWYCDMSPLENLGYGNATNLHPSASRLYRKQYIMNRETLVPGNCSTGQLTSQGAAEHYSLGKHLRARYIDQMRFLSQTWIPQDIWIRSTDVPRTVQSAEAQLLAFYPPKTPTASDTQIIPINVVEEATDNLSPNGRCPELVRLCNAVINSSVWQNKLATMKPLEQSLRSAWNISANQSFPSWVDIFDNLVAREFHYIPFPPGVNKTVYDQVVTFASWQLTTIYNSTQRSSLGIGTFIGELVYQINNLIKNNGTVNPRYLLYSAHDISVTLILSALQIFDGVWPRYASNIEFELYQDTNQSSQWFIGIRYNSRELYLPGCSGNYYCPVNTFLNIASQTTMTPQQWAAACGTTPVTPLSFATYVC